MNVRSGLKRYNLGDRRKRCAAKFEELFTRVAWPNQARNCQGAERSNKNLQCSIQADFPCLGGILDAIRCDSQRRYSDQVISIRRLACWKLAKLVNRNPQNDENKKQEKNGSRGIRANQPDSKKCA